MIFVYITTPSIDEAKNIASFILEQHLAAGVNIFPEVHSMYHWQGKLESAMECVCIFKTAKDNFDALRDAIMTRHSYINPCIVALPVADAAPDFARWIQEESIKRS